MKRVYSLLREMSKISTCDAAKAGLATVGLVGRGKERGAWVQ